MLSLLTLLKAFESFRRLTEGDDALQSIHELGFSALDSGEEKQGVNVSQLEEARGANGGTRSFVPHLLLSSVESVDSKYEQELRFSSFYVHFNSQHV